MMPSHTFFYYRPRLLVLAQHLRAGCLELFQVVLEGLEADGVVLGEVAAQHALHLGHDLVGEKN